MKISQILNGLYKKKKKLKVRKMNYNNLVAEYSLNHFKKGINVFTTCDTIYSNIQIYIIELFLNRKDK